jgi:hypothetical protein
MSRGKNLLTSKDFLIEIPWSLPCLSRYFCILLEPKPLLRKLAAVPESQSPVRSGHKGYIIRRHISRLVFIFP